MPGALKSLELRVKSLELRKMEWIAGDTIYLDEKGVVQDVRTDAKWRTWFGRRLSVWTGGPSAFFHRSLWERLGGFDLNLKYVMDIDLWTRWAKAGIKFEGPGRYVWGFRMHEGSKTMGGSNYVEQVSERRKIDGRYGVSSTGFWRTITRAASAIDGSWQKRNLDAQRFRGMNWSEMIQ